MQVVTEACMQHVIAVENTTKESILCVQAAVLDSCAFPQALEKKKKNSANWWNKAKCFSS